MTDIFEDSACTICGCVCDDLRLTVEEGRITRAEGACFLAEPWFLEQKAEEEILPEIEGEQATFDEAFNRAADILRRSRSPLIYGLSRSSTDGQRAAVSLADRLGATIDTTASVCHAPSIMAFQEVGESTCSLGEIKNRADLVVYWGSDPAENHPRHMERYSADPVGEFLPQGRAERTLVVADQRYTSSAEQADLFLPIEPDRDFEALTALRALVGGIRPQWKTSPGCSIEKLNELAHLMKSCRCGVLFFGLGLTRQPLGHRNVEALLKLVRDLNDQTRFHARRMRVPGDVTGADSVLCWQTGYPFSVNLASGYPRYNPGEFSAGEMLRRGEVDACLLVGSEGVELFPQQALEHLQQIPTIVLEYPTVESLISPTVRFTTAVYGVHARGTAYRMDEIPIPLRAVLPSSLPTDHEVLKKMEQRLIR